MLIYILTSNLNIIINFIFTYVNLIKALSNALLINVLIDNLL